MNDLRILLIEDSPGTPARTQWSAAFTRLNEEEGLRSLAGKPGAYDLVVLNLEEGARQALLAAVRAAAPLADVALAVPAAERRGALPLLALGAVALVDAPPEPLELEALAVHAAERQVARKRARDDAALARALRAQTPDDALPALLDAWVSLLEPDSAFIYLADPGPGTGKLRLLAARELGPPAPSLCWIDELVARRPVPLILQAPQGDLPPAPAPTGPILVVPILYRQRLVGALVAARRTRFDSADLERVAPLAGCARLLLGAPHLQRSVEASDRLATLGQLTASVGHELRSPLAYVVENADFLKSEFEKLAAGDPSGGAQLSGAQLGELRSSAGDAVDGLRRMTELLRDIGALASADEATFVPVDLNEVLRAALRLTRNQVRQRAQVISRLDTDLLVTGNVPRLTQLFVNLLVNAAQALGDRGSGEGRIVITSRHEGARVVVEVSDNGPGIPATVLPRIFDAFFTTKAPVEGTGLGLFLSRDIARAHRGTLNARSSPTRGTTFTLELPHATAPREQPASKPDTPAETTAPGVRLVAV